MTHTAFEMRPYSPLTSNTLSLRSQQDPYRSLPGTPVGLAPRSLNTMDVGPSMDHALSMIQPPNHDYFSNPAARYSTAMRPRSPFPAMAEFGHDGGYPCPPYSTPDMSPDSLTDYITRNNMVATLINSQVVGSAKYAKIFPHVGEDGQYPKEFSTPKTVETMRVLDNSQLDRIMQAYRLPLELSSLERFARGNASHSSSKVRQQKLVTIWEFVGARNLVDYENKKRGIF